MTMNLRCDSRFVEDMGWHAAHSRYEKFVSEHKGSHVLFLELGVGSNTPVIIKYPFWKMTAQNEKAVYAVINREKPFLTKQLLRQTICVTGDIGDMLAGLQQNMQSAER